MKMGTPPTTQQNNFPCSPNPPPARNPHTRLRRSLLSIAQNNIYAFGSLEPPVTLNENRIITLTPTHENGHNPPFLNNLSIIIESSDPAILRTIARIEDEVGTWEGVNVTIHKYGGLQFNVGRKEIGHVHGNGVLDLLLDRQTMLYLVNHRLAHEHHTFRNSGWVTYYIRSEGDYALAIRLLKTGYSWRKNKENKLQNFAQEPALIRRRPLPTTI